MSELPLLPSGWPEYQPGYSPAIEYRPGADPEFLQHLKDKLAHAPHEWAALAVAFDLLRYCDKHCYDIPEAQAAVRMLTGQLTDLASRLNRMGDPDGS